jgi:phospholipase C
VTQVVVLGGGTADQPIAYSGRYDLAVHGPNGFLFAAAGGPDTAGIAVSAALSGTADRPALALTVTNTTSAPATFAAGTDQFTVAPGASHEVPVPASDGWYDLTLTGTADTGWSRRFAGHLENGKPSRTA